MTTGVRRLLAALAAAALGSGCTTLREIPRGEYTAREERRHVRIETREGLVYDFEFVRLEGDSLIGFRRLEIESPFDEFGRLGFAIADVERLSARGVDWRRTGLVGGGLLAAVVAAGLATAGDDGGDGSGGGGGRVP